MQNISSLNIPNKHFLHSNILMKSNLVRNQNQNDNIFPPSKENDTHFRFFPPASLYLTLEFGPFPLRTFRFTQNDDRENGMFILKIEYILLHCKYINSLKLTGKNFYRNEFHTRNIRLLFECCQPRAPVF